MDWKAADLILFDLDGTLVDSVPDLASAIDTMLKELGLAPAGVDRVGHWVGNGAAVLVSRALAAAKGKQFLPDSIDSDLLFARAYDRFLFHYDQSNGEASQLFNGVIDFLEACQQLSKKMAIVTNKPMAFTEVLLQKLGIRHYFCDIAGGDSFPEKKPHPMPLLTLASRNHSLRPLMIGDSMHDVQAARAAGMPVIGVSYGYNHGTDISLSQPDLVIDSLTRLL